MSFTTSLGYTPQYQIHKNGDDITGQFNDRVTVIKIQSFEGQGQGDKLEMSMDDRDWLIATPSANSSSADQLQVNLGYAQSGLYDQGTFNVDTIWIEGLPKTLRLAATSQGFTSALKAPIITAYAGKTVQNVIDAIATAGGFSSSVDPDLGSKTIEYLHQQSSSMHLLQSLERTYNGIAKFQDGMLSFTKRGSGSSATGILSQSFELTPEDFAGWSFKVSNRTAYSKVRAGYRDKTTNQIKWIDSSGTPPTSSTAPFLIKTPHNSQDEAQSAADAMQGSLNRGIITGTITLAKGDPSIHGGFPFTVSSMKDDVMNGSYIVKTATHTYTKESGITTLIDFYQPDGASSSAGGSSSGSATGAGGGGYGAS